jgi:gliding motility-associated-like protein
MFTIFSVSVSTPSLQSKIYKHTPPYAPANIAWSAFSGYFSVTEPGNRPYSGSIDNSSNTIAINNNYLFYWDGKNLKAFNKATGNAAGTVLTLNNTAMMQGGIFADECDNVFIGSTNGTIKVYSFNGSVFNDAAAADINIPGFSTNSVYDITFDHANNLIYTCGDGFVASIDVSQYCATLSYNLTVFTDAANLTATANLTPAATPGSVVTFSLFSGSLLMSSNTTGIFTGLSLGINYTIKAFINQLCGGTQVTKDFTLGGTQPQVNTPAIYVPNAFTPNGANNILKIVLYGMRELHYFSIYNRYGQLVFTTKDPAIGWDGKFKGKAQNTGTFVWVAEAVDQRGNIIREKGTSTLIR